jgi:hypothetical protein
MEKLWWWIIESWDFNLSTETAHAKLRRIDQFLRCPVQSPTFRTYDIHFSHIMNSPIRIKWLTGQGQRGLDREVGKMRGIVSWMRKIRLCDRKIRRRRRGIVSQMRKIRLCNRKIRQRRGIDSQMRYMKNGMRWWKYRKRQDIANWNKWLRDLQIIYWNWQRTLSL